MGGFGESGRARFKPFGLRVHLTSLTHSPQELCLCRRGKPEIFFKRENHENSLNNIKAFDPKFSGSFSFFFLITLSFDTILSRLDSTQLDSIICGQLRLGLRFHCSSHISHHTSTSITIKLPSDLALAIDVIQCFNHERRSFPGAGDTESLPVGLESQTSVIPK